jgi:hypothetical protein
VRPSDQTVFTNGAANTITANRTVAVTADGASIGTANPSLSWTPGAVDLDVDLSIGNGVTRKVAVAATTNVSANLTTWTAGNVSVTANTADYAGGTSAYRVRSTSNANVAHFLLSAAPSPANANTKSCLEFIARPSSSSVMPYLVFTTAASGNRNAIWAASTAQSSSAKTYFYPVEDMGGGWYRYWAGIADGQNATSLQLFLTNTLDIATAGTCTLTTNDYVDISHVRMVDGLLPFYGRQKSTFWQNGTASVVGATRWQVGTEFYDSASQWGGSLGLGAVFLDVLVPDTYTTSKSYRWILVNPVEANPFPAGTYANELQVLKDLDVHNTMDCIIVRPYGTRSWGGVKNDGTLDHDSFFSVMIPAFMEATHSVSRNREARTIMGYSASGFAALTQLNRRPDVWGYCVAWDCPVSAAYAAFDQNFFFGTEAQYNAYNPKTHFAAAGWSDRARLVFGGYNTFQTDTTDMYTVLESGIGTPINNGGGDYATTVTNSTAKWWKVHAGAPTHDFLSEWVSPAMTGLAYLWSR